MATFLECALIAEDVYSDKSDTDGGVLSTIGYRRRSELSKFSGRSFYGAAYVSVEGIGIIAFRGSKEIEDWLKDDIDISNKCCPIDQLGDAFDYFSFASRELGKLNCNRYLVVGHSLGGALAQVVAGAVSQIPVRGVTFNAPGMANYKSFRVKSIFEELFDESILPVLGKATDILPAALSAALLQGVNNNNDKLNSLGINSKVGGKLDIPVKNKIDDTINKIHNRVMVFNVMHEDDPVSKQGAHIGDKYIIPYADGWDRVKGKSLGIIQKTVMNVEGNGLCHTMGALIERLRVVKEGYYRV